MLLTVGCERTDGDLGAARGQHAQRDAGLAAEGTMAPAFEATAHSGQVVKSSQLRGKKVVLYFYPKDDTPGCTIEAREIRDEWAGFQEANTVVLGVSADDNESHVQFAEKHDLPFLLLPDSDHVIARAYGVPVRLGVTKRVTFVIDEEGRIAKTFDDVNPNGHATEVMKAVMEL